MLFLISRKHNGHQPDLGQGPTPPSRGVVPMATSKEMKSGKLGSLFLKKMNMKNMNMRKMNAKIKTCYYKS